MSKATNGLDYAEISRTARRIVDASRAKSVLEGAIGNASSSDASAPSTSGAGPTGGPRKRPRFSRSTNGCLGCRRAKVKCDETRPDCLRCIGAERQCVWPKEGGRKRRPRGSVQQIKSAGGMSRQQLQATGDDDAEGEGGSHSNDEDGDDGDSRSISAALLAEQAAPTVMPSPTRNARQQSSTNAKAANEHARLSGASTSAISSISRQGGYDGPSPTHLQQQQHQQQRQQTQPTQQSPFSMFDSGGMGVLGDISFDEYLPPISPLVDSSDGAIYQRHMSSTSSQGHGHVHIPSNAIQPQHSTGHSTGISPVGQLPQSHPQPQMRPQPPHLPQPPPQHRLSGSVSPIMQTTGSIFNTLVVNPADLHTHQNPSGPASSAPMPTTGNTVVFPRLGPAVPNLDLPPLSDLNRSSLLSKRKNRAKAESSRRSSISSKQTDMLSGTTQLRLAMVESILHAFSYDDSLFEFGPSHRTRNILNTLSVQLSTDILSLAFPSPAARLLFHFYCNTTSRILITMGNVGPNPLLALCTPLKLLDTASAWAGAIRMSILSISASHFAHETEESVGAAVLGPDWPGKKERLKALSRKFKKAALCNVYLGTGSEDPYQVDSILAACTLLCIRDVIDADTSWQDNLDFALRMISKKGGPQAMLKAPDSTFTRRYLLENLAVHDVFGCFITGKEPALLGNYDPWWFDSVESSTTRWEWESVEQTFGISRTVVDLLARVAVLDSRKRRLEINMSANPEELGDVGQFIVKESQSLLLELDILGNSLSALPQHSRVTCGDYAYKYMAAVFVLADILQQPIHTPRIVQDVDSILELLSEASVMRMSVMLVWPLIIAGVFCLPQTRSKVRELFEAFDPYYCEDIRAARELLEEQWRGMDLGGGKRSWQEVMEVTGRKVLLI